MSAGATPRCGLGAARPPVKAGPGAPRSHYPGIGPGHCATLYRGTAVRYLSTLRLSALLIFRLSSIVARTISRN